MKITPISVANADDDGEKTNWGDSSELNTALLFCESVQTLTSQWAATKLVKMTMICHYPYIFVDDNDLDYADVQKAADMLILLGRARKTEQEL